MRYEMSVTDDFVTYSGKINWLCEDFKIGSIIPDAFKSLMFIVGLKYSKYSAIVTRLLNTLETLKEDEKPTLTLMTNESIRVTDLKQDTARVENDTNTVSFVKQRQDQKSNPSQSTHKVPSSRCWNRGNMHYSKLCKFKTNKCNVCGIIGHKNGFCKQTKESKQKQPKQRQSNQDQQPSVNHVQVNLTQSERKFVQVKIHGTNITLQLDSGSDVTIISEQNWSTLNAPVLSAVIKDAQGHKMSFLGLFFCEIELKGISKTG